MTTALNQTLDKWLSNFRFFHAYLGHRVFVRMGLSTLTGIFDGFGLAMFLPLLQSVGGNMEATESGKNDGNLSFLTETIEGMGIPLNLTNVLWILVFFFVLKGITSYISLVYQAHIRELFIRKIRMNIVTKLSDSSFQYFVTSDVGRIQNSATSEVTKLSDAFTTYFDTIQHLALILVYVGFAFFVDIKFALLISAGGLLTNYLFTKLFANIKETSKKTTSVNHGYQGLIIQLVTNFKYLKASNTIHKINSKIGRVVNEIVRNNIKMEKLYAFATGTREPLVIVIVSIVIYLHINVFEGEIGVVLISLIFFYRALSAMMQMLGAYSHHLMLAGSLDNIQTFEVELDAAREQKGTEKIERFRHSISLENASFGYNDQHDILKNVTLEIKKNSTVALVGESGSGKTTLANILCGLLRISNGKLSIDGIDMESMDRDSYRSRIGYIAQEPVIFNDTIFNNVSLWDSPTEENYQRFLNAVRQASLYDFVTGLADKHLTLLGNNGINISGGQKQRISIARELYKNIDILILDEATSALDSETEIEVQQKIDMLKGNLTIIIIAHRLSTIKNADQVVLLKGGEIQDVNTFDELKRTSTHFKKMVDLQLF